MRATTRLPVPEIGRLGREFPRYLPSIMPPQSPRYPLMVMWLRPTCCAISLLGMPVDEP
jgi:hypothetical protein